MIDADRAVERYSKKLKKLIYRGADSGNPACEAIRDIMRAFDRQPTAYDVDAVVRELEEKIKHHWERANYCHDNELYIAESEHVGKCEAFREAIEIVKRGGRNEG